MRTVNSLPSKATRYTCERCGISSPEPIVKPVANPKDETHGRCSNTQACEQRQRAAVRGSRRAKREEQ